MSQWNGVVLERLSQRSEVYTSPHSQTGAWERWRDTRSAAQSLIQDKPRLSLEAVAIFHRWRHRTLQDTFAKKLRLILQDVADEEEASCELQAALAVSREREAALAERLARVEVHFANAGEEARHLRSHIPELQALHEAADARSNAWQERALAAEAALDSLREAAGKAESAQRAGAGAMVEAAEKEQEAGRRELQRLLDCLSARDSQVLQLTQEAKASRAEVLHWRDETARLEGIVRATGERAAAAEDAAASVAALKAELEAAHARDELAQAEVRRLQGMLDKEERKLEDAAAVSAALAAGREAAAQGRDEVAAQLAATRSELQSLGYSASLAEALKQALSGNVSPDAAQIIQRLGTEVDIQRAEVAALGARLAAAEVMSQRLRHRAESAGAWEEAADLRDQLRKLATDVDALCTHLSHNSTPSFAPHHPRPHLFALQQPVPAAHTTLTVPAAQHLSGESGNGHTSSSDPTGPRHVAEAGNYGRSDEVVEGQLGDSDAAGHGTAEAVALLVAALGKRPEEPEPSSLPGSRPRSPIPHSAEIGAAGSSTLLEALEASQRQLVEAEALAGQLRAQLAEAAEREATIQKDAEAAVAEAQAQLAARRDHWAGVRGAFCNSVPQCHGRALLQRVLWQWRWSVAAEGAEAARAAAESAALELERATVQLEHRSEALERYLEGQALNRRHGLAVHAVHLWRQRAIRQAAAHISWWRLANSLLGHDTSRSDPESAAVHPTTAQRLCQLHRGTSPRHRHYFRGAVDDAHWRSLAFRAWAVLARLGRERDRWHDALDQVDALTNALPFWIQRVGSRRLLERCWLAWRVKMVATGAAKNAQLLSALKTLAEAHAADPRGHPPTTQYPSSTGRHPPEPSRHTAATAHHRTGSAAISGHHSGATAHHRMGSPVGRRWREEGWAADPWVDPSKALHPVHDPHGDPERPAWKPGGIRPLGNDEDHSPSLSPRRHHTARVPAPHTRPLQGTLNPRSSGHIVRPQLAGIDAAAGLAAGLKTELAAFRQALEAAGVQADASTAANTAVASSNQREWPQIASGVQEPPQPHGFLQNSSGSAKDGSANSHGTGTAAELGPRLIALEGVLDAVCLALSEAHVQMVVEKCGQPTITVPAADPNATVTLRIPVASDPAPSSFPAFP